MDQAKWLNPTSIEKNIFLLSNTVKPGISKIFENPKNVYYCQVFTIYHVIYAMICHFGKQQKVY